jgi:antitoxin (DNA-binding transcriptional repressor) of toxin-antitoxin stability system
MKKQISKSQFKARALEYFRKIESTGETVIVTDHGTPTIEVRPYRKTERGPLNLLRGSVVEYINPMESVGEDEWEAIK